MSIRTLNYLLIFCMGTAFMLELSYAQKQSYVADRIQEYLPTSLFDENEGFVKLPPNLIDEKEADTVIVYILENAGTDQRRRAQNIINSLAKKRIPFKEKKELDFVMTGQADSFDNRRINAAMQGESPIVVVKGWIRANPTDDQVINRYRKPN